MLVYIVIILVYIVIILVYIVIILVYIVIILVYILHCKSSLKTPKGFAIPNIT